ncbi:hypothetical protein OX284_014275 [Flavobacterium sp. SUN046]|uniref:hypothetical protein n=1 Tax=Flavobacterium sp. SUN046 TaxID=3002440 RepID=UPI002DBFAD72|nr:hypothetical protein [Flavobacterium sp. SUN046]MEC4050602.1 hypothetical protein [Flavobacterium sp. SUN046]
MQVDIIDSCENVILNLAIGQNIFIREFTNSITGIKNIAFEFGNTGKDYDETLVYLRFKHTVSNSAWYSNGFFITAVLQEETTRFAYMNEGYLQGVPYDSLPYFQTIRLSCFKNDVDSEIDSETYTQTSGNRVTLFPILTPIIKYLFYTLDEFTYQRLIRLSLHEIVYIDKYKSSDKLQVTKGERIPETNIFDCNFDVNLTEDYFDEGYQLFKILDVVARSPIDKSKHHLSGFNKVFTLNFNKEIALESGITAKLYENNVLVSTITPTISTPTVLRLDFSAYTFIDANYTIEIAPNMVYSSLTLFPEYWKGFAYGDWTTEITEVPFCILPTLVSVTRNVDDSLTYVWDNNGFSYGSGTAMLQISIDGGTTYNSIEYANPDDLIWTTDPQAIAHGTPIKYRVELFGNGCINQKSNIITTTF